MKFDPEALRSIRTRQKLTHQELAWKAGVTVSTISRAENGHHTPEPATVYALAGALQVDLMDLFERVVA